MAYDGSIDDGKAENAGDDQHDDNDDGRCGDLIGGDAIGDDGGPLLDRDLLESREQLVGTLDRLASLPAVRLPNRLGKRADLVVRTFG